MKFLVAVLLLLPGFVRADLLPEALGEFERQEVEKAVPEQPELYEEYGLEDAETALYLTGSGQKARVTSQQFYDDTGAFSAFRRQQSKDGMYSGFGERSWTDDDSTMIHFANYVVTLEGDMPLDDHIELMLTFLPRVRPTPDPPVLAYVPDTDLKGSVQRHILGPVGLAEVLPEISPSTAGFHFGTEVHYAEYRIEDGVERMALFYYPTPQMAREQVEKFREVEGVIAKRTGPIIAAVVGSSSPDTAERLMSRVRYEADVTPHFKKPERSDDLTTVVLDTFVLVGILISLFVVGGIFVAGTRMLASRVAPNSLFAVPKGDGLTRLELDESEERRRQ